MNFDYSDEQQQLADSLQKYLASHYGFEQRKAILNSASGVSDTVWTTFAEMGLTSIALPEADGGFGGGAVDLMAAMEACGEALVVEPLLDNVGLAGRLLSRCGSAAQRSAWLPGLIDGAVRESARPLASQHRDGGVGELVASRVVAGHGPTLAEPRQVLYIDRAQHL